MRQPFLYDMSPSSSKVRPSPFPLTHREFRGFPLIFVTSVTNLIVARLRFAGIGPSDYKDTKVSIFFSEVIGITVGHHDCCGSIYELLVKCLLLPRTSLGDSF